VTAAGTDSVALLTTSGRLLVAPVAAVDLAPPLAAVGLAGGVEARVRGLLSALADVGTCERRVASHAQRLRSEVCGWRGRNKPVKIRRQSVWVF
jgi:hypothetical protein